MNFEKHRELPVDHSVVLPGMPRKGQFSSAGGCISKSPRTKSSSKTSCVDNSFCNVVQRKEHGLWSQTELDSELCYYLQPNAMCTKFTDVRIFPYKADERLWRRERGGNSLR